MLSLKPLNKYTEENWENINSNISEHIKVFNKNILYIVRYLKGGLSTKDLYGLTSLEFELYLSNINEMIEEENKAINSNGK